jgi:ferric-dicitrate binding protein FerR (iron transport regulator)
MKNDQSFWDLTAAKLHHELNPEEEAAFEELIKGEGNQSAFQKAEKIHKGLIILKGINKGSSWKQVDQRIRHAVFKRFAVTSLKYAAIVLVTFFIGNYVHSFWQQDNKIQYAEIEVLNGQMGHLFLFDGTEVWLNSGSRFKYPNQFNRDERNVFLDGEAFFNVTPDKHLPFIVKTNKMEIEVLGTSFSVSSYHDEERQSVVLEEGKVRINKENGQKIAELLPGQRASRAGATSLQHSGSKVSVQTFIPGGKMV